MHMADALISPAVGGTMWGISGVAIGYCSGKMKKSFDDFKVPLMGVMGAFIFAAQMINFTIPGTGSSGHIVGSLLLSIVLGPYAALLVIASVLVVQALLFADGGLLALGCNIFNMGIIPCLVAYPLIYRVIAGKKPTAFRLWAGCITASVIGLQIGAFSVVVETTLSGISELSFISFILLMLPIHLAIGAVEGVITASVYTLIRNTRPELEEESLIISESGKSFSLKGIITGFIAAALITGGAASWFASENPDGLEWAIAKVTGGKELATKTDTIHSNAEKIQEKTSLLPDYGFKSSESSSEENRWGSVNPGTTVSGIIGSVITLLLALCAGLILKFKFQRKTPAGVKFNGENF